MSEPSGGGPTPGGSGVGDLNAELIAAPIWSDEQVQRAGIPVVDRPVVSVGGGLGSFALVDVLRIAGVGTGQIAVLTDLDVPYRSYRYLAANSQIPDEERIRSDSGSVLDNIWGWPGYALREAVGERTLRPIWQVLTEPILSDYYTPRASRVYASVDREAARIDWPSMCARGLARMIRRRHGGGYFVLHTPTAGSSPTKRVAYRCSYAHVAVGYPGVRFLPDLQAYRERYDDFTRVVNAYEPHAHVYEEALRRPCTVLVRGSGIVASRILQRLLDDRERRGAPTTVIHLFRTYVSGPQGDSLVFRRPGRDGWAYQGFNFPKSAWGGQLKDRIERLEGDERARMLEAVGGTNTAPRRSWRRQLARGTAGGWYVQRVGEVISVEPTAEHRVKTVVATREGEEYGIDASFVIDATGLEGEITEHRLLADLLEWGGAGRNPLGRLDVARDFEVRGTRSEPGRLFASGSATLGGYYAGVDSFLGLQYAALRIADVLAARGLGRRIGVGRSVRQWLRWSRNARP